MLRIMASDPGFGVVDDLWRLYAVLKNPQVWMNENDMDEVEMQEVLRTLETHMGDLVDGLPPVFLQAVLHIEE